MISMIDKTFTEKLTALLSQGYNIATSEMGGSSGEIAKVTLHKDGLYYALYAEHTSHWGSEIEPWGDTINIIFGQAEEGYQAGNTFWLHHVQPIETVTFYALSTRGCHYHGEGPWTADKATATAAWRKRWDRMTGWRHYATRNELTSEAAISAAYHFLKKREGYTTLRKHNVQKVVITRGDYTSIHVEVAKPSGQVRGIEIFNSHCNKKAA